MSTLEKLEADYKAFVERSERTAASDIEKLRLELGALKEKAKNFPQNA